MADFTYTQGDLRPIMRFRLFDENGPLDISSASAVTLYAWDTIGTVISRACTIENGALGICTYTPDSTDTARPGVFQLAARITWSGSIYQYVPSIGEKRLRIKEKAI